MVPSKDFGRPPAIHRDQRVLSKFKLDPLAIAPLG